MDMHDLAKAIAALAGKGGYNENYVAPPPAAAAPPPPLPPPPPPATMWQAPDLLTPVVMPERGPSKNYVAPAAMGQPPDLLTPVVMPERDANAGPEKDPGWSFVQQPTARAKRR